MTTLEEVWVTKDGRRLAVGEMRADHARNALRMVIRNRRRLRVKLKKMLHSVSLLEAKQFLRYLTEHADDDGFEWMLMNQLPDEEDIEPHGDQA